ncbi:hypothetical protein [Haloferula sp. BvORR071]|uniref:hypothetical protein n=1 Tax=Haloferula sp. BvORR071 TaxID=1396141 RepID=UPI000553CA23|nr:hypothetical protein [Haloferula sp. BvORR071]
MRAAALVFSMACLTASARADLEWHEFDHDAKLHIGELSVTVEGREVPDAAFKEDHLLLTVQKPGGKPHELWLNSTYASGAVAVHGNYLLVEYGIGRGTFARVRHVKILNLDGGLEELADGQRSYYLPTDHDPEEVIYQIDVKEEEHRSVLTFTLPAARPGLPAEKVVAIRNESRIVPGR